MNDEERDALLWDIDDKVDGLKLELQRVRDALFDTDGKEGLCSKVDKVCVEVDKHGNSIMRLWIVITVIAGGGGGTFGVIELIKRLSG